MLLISTPEEEEDDFFDQLTLQPFRYLTAIPGKKIRPMLIEALNCWLNIPREKVDTISQIVSDFHNTTLLVDDIQDGSLLRRGIPATHLVFGLLKTIISADYVFGDSVAQLKNLHPEAGNIYQDMKKEVFAGQGLELYWRDRFCCPTEKEYLQMITKKTGGTFLLAYRLMKLFSNYSKDLEGFLINLGLYFQINDDYQNLNSKFFFDTKGFCEDITEGKYGFPTVHAVRTHPAAGKEIEEILQEKTFDVARKKHCVALIENCGSFNYTRNTLEHLKKLIFKEVEELGGNPYMYKVLEKIIPPS